MGKFLTESRMKELLEKREYYKEHPEEARKEYVKKFDGIGMIPVEPKEQKKTTKSKNLAFRI